MKFNDYTLLGGAIKTRRVFYTEKLVPEAIQICAEMLKKLRAGEEFSEHLIPNMPPFGVSLGPPLWLLEASGERVEAPGRFFCVGEKGRDPFQFNLILDAGAIDERDDRAVATALALSLLDGTPTSKNLGTEEAVEMQIREITQSRPCIATAMIPSYNVSFELVTISADFATCFSAAMLLER